MTGDPWIDRLDTVTPDDIRRNHQEALDDGADRAELDRYLERAIREAGGTIEHLAQEWTRRNRLAQFQAQLRRRRLGKQ